MLRSQSQITSKKKDTARWKKARHWRADESEKMTNRRMQHSSTNFIHQRRCKVAGIEGGGGSKQRIKQK
ncbi:conserved hypothetical protein [Aspergillus fumigatus A1163]|uniref:Uncharacterized protein n=1 Tax=Aspergillus fumigatus (strain CBS 144.89 / FGSC A1163 / CEA10) TaxID=451804 RepID=B0Y6T2_ASPFC|nr:conserved hypothetical protein [Aspergillus fumigatus A1163]